VHDEKEKLFTVYDDISGITFRNNLIAEGLEPLQQEGFMQKPVTLSATGNGIKLPEGHPAAGKIRERMDDMATPENCGVTWYERREESQFFGTGAERNVAPGENTLLDAVLASEPGDVLRLAPGEYLQTKAIALRHPLTITGAGDEKPLIVFQKSSLRSRGPGSTTQQCHQHQPLFDDG